MITFFLQGVVIFLILLCSVPTPTDNMPFDYFLPTHIMLFMLRRQIICCWFGQRHSHACGASIDAVNVIRVYLLSLRVSAKLVGSNVQHNSYSTSSFFFVAGDFFSYI
jgi:hypothetical protein